MIGICTFCGEFGKVHAHHLTSRNKIILCKSCHRIFHNYALRSYLGIEAGPKTKAKFGEALSSRYASSKTLGIDYDEIKPIKPEGRKRGTGGPTTCARRWARGPTS